MFELIVALLTTVNIWFSSWLFLHWMRFVAVYLLAHAHIHRTLSACIAQNDFNEHFYRFRCGCQFMGSYFVCLFRQLKHYFVCILFSLVCIFLSFRLCVIFRFRHTILLLTFSVCVCFFFYPHQRRLHLSRTIDAAVVEVTLLSRTRSKCSVK